MFEFYGAAKIIALPNQMSQQSLTTALCAAFNCLRGWFSLPLKVNYVEEYNNNQMRLM